MAVAGGATTAYQMWLEGNKVFIGERGTRLGSLCDNPATAALKILTRPEHKSDRPWVAGGDVVKVKQLVEQALSESEEEVT